VLATIVGIMKFFKAIPPDNVLGFNMKFYRCPSLIDVSRLFPSQLQFACQWRKRVIAACVRSCRHS
jgi:hypothetical protein